MPNELKVKQGLIVDGSGSAVLEVNGNAGDLLTVYDQSEGILLSVRNISANPLFEVSSSGDVYMPQLSSSAQSYVLTYNNASGQVYYTASSAIIPTMPDPSRIVTGSVTASVNVGTTSFRLTSGSRTFMTVDNTGNTVFNSGSITASGNLQLDSGNILLFNSGGNRGLNVANNFAIQNPGSIGGANQSSLSFGNSPVLYGTNTIGFRAGGSTGLNSVAINSITTNPSSVTMSFGYMRNEGLKTAIINTVDWDAGNSAHPPVQLYIYPGKQLNGNIQADLTLCHDGTQQRGNVLVGLTGSRGYKLDVSGSGTSGSLNVNNTLFVSGSTTTATGSMNVLKVQGSGSAFPLFSVLGSLGELFTVTDNLSGSLFSVNDISGLPILDVNSDLTTKIGNYIAPGMYTSTKVTADTGVRVIYSIPTASYDSAYFDYNIRSGSVGRVGQIMAMWSGSSVNFTEVSASSFGTTSTFVFGVSISGSNMILSGSVPTNGWTVKTIVKAI